MKTCEKIFDRLSEFVDGDLEATEMKSISEHVASCDKCRKTADDMKLGIEAVKSFLEAEGRTVGQSDITDKVMSRIRSESMQIGAEASFKYKYPAFAAALLLIFLGVFSMTKLSDRIADTQHSPAPSLHVSVMTDGIEIEDDVDGDVRMVSVRP